jgi:hypothetical protein
MAPIKFQININEKESHLPDMKHRQEKAKDRDGRTVSMALILYHFVAVTRNTSSRKTCLSTPVLTTSCLNF